MTWFKVDDTLCSHDKARRAGLAAMGLWALCGAWCAQQMNDGWVPTWVAHGYRYGSRMAPRLVQVGLWHEPGHTCEKCPQISTGYIFHEWEQANPTRSEIEAKRQVKRTSGQAGGWASGRSRREARASRVSEAEPKHDASALANSRPGPARPIYWGSLGEGELRDVPRASAPPSQHRCVEHEHDDDPPPCGACARAREAAQRHESSAADRDRDRRRTLALELANARSDPRKRCGHGTDGGKHVRSDTGQPLCALCRARQEQEATP